MDEEEAEIDLFGESTLGNLHFADSSDDEEAGRLPPLRRRRRIDDVLGLHNAEDILTMPWEELRSRTQTLLGELGVPVRVLFWTERPAVCLPSYTVLHNARSQPHWACSHLAPGSAF